MSTTYAKIRATLAEMGGKPAWGPQELKAQLIERDKKRQESHFHTRQNSSITNQPLSDSAFDKLFDLMLELELIRKNKSEDFFITDTVKASLDDEARYKLLLSRRINALLDKNDANLSEIKRQLHR